MALRRLLPQALVLACLAGGTAAYVSQDKEVELSVDGTSHTVHTFADDVRDVLAEQGLHPDEHDLVAPSPAQRIANGEEIAVRYGRPVTLTVDGRRREVWTTAHTVDAALRQLGVRAQGAHLSASRGSAIGRRGLALRVRTERTVTLDVDGHERAVTTTAPTVRQALARAGVTLGPHDTASVPLGSFPEEGQTVSVQRITSRKKVREERIGFETVRREDPGLPRGTEVVTQHGASGVRRVTYRIRTVDGVRKKAKRIDSEILRHPRRKIIHVGSRQEHHAHHHGHHSSGTPTVGGTGGLDWAALAQCESGGRPGAMDPSGTYGGLYQMDTRTWHSIGGSGAPQNASPSEQTYRAKKLYVSRGASPWPVCGRKLTG